MLRQSGRLPEGFGRVHVVRISVGIPAARLQQIDLICSLDDVRKAAAERLTQLPLLMLHVQRDNGLPSFKEVQEQ